MSEPWKDFESNILSHSKINNLFILKIPEAVRLKKGYRPIRVKTAFDFTASIDGLAMFFDAKCVSTRDSWNYAKYMLDDKRIHQWNSLQEAYDKGNISGLLFWFTQKGLIGWASVPTIRESLKTETYLGPETAGVVWQSDQIPIDLRSLTREDTCKVKKRFASANHV